MTENTVLDKNTSSIIKKEGIRFRNNNSDFPNLKRLKLGNILLIQRGGSPRPIEDYITDDENGVNWIKIGDAPANGSNRIVSAKEKIKASGKSKSREVKKGDLILSNSMSFGKPYILEIDGYIHDGWLLLRDTKKEFNLSYLCELLGSPNVLSQYKRLAAGSTVNNLNKDLVASVTVNLPCIEEQKKIADFLLSIDDIISSQEERISTLETYNRGLLNDIFERKIKFKNEDGEKYPNWEEKPLSEEFPFIRNGFVGIVTDHFSDKEHGIRYIEGTNIRNGRIDDNVEVYVTKEFHQKHKKNELKSDDIVMVQSGHVGDCAVVGSKYAGSNCHALIIMSNGGKVDSRYVAKYFLSDVGKKNLEILKTGNTVKHILSSDMNKFRLPFPCLEEQQKIADCLSAIDKVVEQEKVYLEQLKTIKKGLLQQMFV